MPEGTSPCLKRARNKRVLSVQRETRGRYEQNTSSLVDFRLLAARTSRRPTGHGESFGRRCRRRLGEGCLAERLSVFREEGPAGYKFLAEFAQDGKPSRFRDLVVAHPDRRIAEAEANKHLTGATKVDMITLSSSDLIQLKLEKGQIRTGDGILSIGNSN